MTEYVVDRDNENLICVYEILNDYGIQMINKVFAGPDPVGTRKFFSNTIRSKKIVITTLFEKA